MTAPDQGWSHDLLVHDTDDELLETTVPFVHQGIDAGGRVLVHGTERYVDLLQGALGEHPRLTFAFDADLYHAPTSTLFDYQQQLAESTETNGLWVAGTVPLGDEPVRRHAWERYESLVNEVLRPYAFHALCTYDTRLVPADAIAMARATHPCVNQRGARSASPEYQDPARFLLHPVAGVPAPPQAPATVTATVTSRSDLRPARGLLHQAALSASAVPRQRVESLILAAHEVLLNAVEHGGLPATLSLWAEPAKLTCVVSDTGPGVPELLAGCRYPEQGGQAGLWIARQLCDDFVITNDETGCTVLLTCAA